MYAPKRKSQGGYSLIELLMVIVIISITASLTVPGITSAMADRQAAFAAREMLLFPKQGAAEAIAYRRAHVVYFNANNNGTLRLIRGMHSSCLRHNWNAMGNLISTNCGGQNDYCLGELQGDTVDMYSGYTLRIREVNAASEFALCYTPSGVVWHAESLNGPWREDNLVIGGSTTLGGGYRLIIEKMQGATVHGVARTLLMPLGGTPRVQR